MLNFYFIVFPSPSALGWITDEVAAGLEVAPSPCKLRCLIPVPGEPVARPRFAGPNDRNF
jgi:hypothetical protein